MRSAMRILYVCADEGIPIRGHKGASVHVRSITGSLRARGHDVVLACSSLGNGVDSPQVTTVIEVGSDPADVVATLDELLGAGSFDVVIERYSLGSGPAGRAAARHHVPLLLEVNAPIVLEAARYRGLSDVPEWLAREQEVFAAAEEVIVVSSQLRTYVSGVCPDVPVTVVPNGVDTERFGPGAAMKLGVAANDVLIGFVGTMKPWHGVEDLVTASQGVLERHAGCRLVVAGDGPCLPLLRAQVGALGLEHRVAFLGPLAHSMVPAFINATDVAAAPYRPSPDFYFSPLKILEYMASGRPTVYPDVGDLPQLVGDGGVSYPAGSVEDLETTLELLVCDHTLRRRLGRAARERALQKHSWDRVAGRIEEIAAWTSGRVR
jgi:glycosyltransferase involved in cell wall biosynthesis